MKQYNYLLPRTVKDNYFVVRDIFPYSPAKSQFFETGNVSVRAFDCEIRLRNSIGRAKTSVFRAEGFACRVGELRRSSRLFGVHCFSLERPSLELDFSSSKQHQASLILRVSRKKSCASGSKHKCLCFEPDARSSELELSGVLTAWKIIFLRRPHLSRLSICGRKFCRANQPDYRARSLCRHASRNCKLSNRRRRLHCRRA